MHKEDMNHGFTMKFKNGWTISVRWGAVNYCANQGSYSPGKHNVITDKYNESNTAEVAIFDPMDNMDALTDYDQVKGWQTPNDVVMIMLCTMRRGANERAKMPKSWEDDDEEIESAERSHRGNSNELNMEED
jgi:hypothetical protein